MFFFLFFFFFLCGGCEGGGGGGGEKGQAGNVTANQQQQYMNNSRQTQAVYTEISGCCHIHQMCMSRAFHSGFADLHFMSSAVGFATTQDFEITYLPRRGTCNLWNDIPACNHEEDPHTKPGSLQSRR